MGDISKTFKHVLNNWETNSPGFLTVWNKDFFFPKPLIKINLYCSSDVYFANRINQRINDKLAASSMESIDIWQLVSWTQLCFEPADRSKKDHTIFDTNRKTEISQWIFKGELGFEILHWAKEPPVIGIM